MSKLEKIINTKNNTFVLSNLKIKQAKINSKSTSNKSSNKIKIKYTNKIKDKNSPIKLSKIIIDFLLNLNEMDNSIENIRVKLYSSSNFVAQNLFDYLDRNSKKFLSLSDFKFFLRDNQITFSEKNLRKLIHNFDKNNDFSLNFDEFLGMIYPKKNKQVPNTHSEEEGLDSATKKIFCELLCAELNFVEKCFELSENVRNQKEFTAYEAFKEIVGEEKYININNLKNYLNNKEVKLSDNDMNQLMFRIDKDNDGLISYEEFKDIFSPLSGNIDLNNYTTRNYNKDILAQYDNDDEKDDIQLDVKNINNNINNNSNNKAKPKYSVSIKNENEKNINFKENKENDKNIINIKKAEERYNFDLDLNLDNNKNIKTQKKIISNTNTEIDNNKNHIPSNSLKIYKENIKNTKTEIDNNKMEYDEKTYHSKNKSINNYSSRSFSNNNLLEHTKSILGIGQNNLVNKIKVNSYLNNTNISMPKNMKKRIIEIEYENDCDMETQIRNIEKINKPYQNEKVNDNNTDIISDSALNFDYSRFTNKDRHNGSYYFKQRNKGEIIESNNNSTNNISNLSQDENNKNNVNKNKNKDILLRNNNKIKNTNKKNSFSLEYNYNNLFSFKDEMNFKEKEKSINSKINKTQFQTTNQTFNEENIDQKNILNFNYTKENKTDIINNSSTNNDTSYKTENRNAQKYLDSLENINQENIDESPLDLEQNINQYHYKIKLTRNLTRNNIPNQAPNKNKSKNNYFFKEPKNIKNYNINNINDNQNKSCLMPKFKAETDLFNKEFDNMDINIYNSNPQNMCNSCESNKCPNCKCKKIKNINLGIYNQNENDNDIFIYKNNNNINNINNNNGRKTKTRKSSSLPKDYYTYKDNNLNLDYSIINIENNNNHNIYERNSEINKINFYHTNKTGLKNIYRNPPKRNNNNTNYNLNKSYFYLESTSKNNNFKLNQLDNKIPKNNINNNNNNKNKINMNNYNLNKKSCNSNNNISNSNKFTSLYNLFLDFIKQDNAIETMRQLISGRDDSNLMDLFSLFDHRGNKLIFVSDFIQSLKEFGLLINKEDIKYIYRKFNKKLNESFDFDEFCEIVLPKKHSNEKIMNIGNWSNLSKNKNYYRGISIETKKMLGLLFKNIIEGEKSNEKYRRILVGNNELSGFDLFNKIKKNYSVGIYKEDIANFMKKNKYKLNNNEIELIMDRFDKNKNGMIDYKEFIIEISPMNKQ